METWSFRDSILAAARRWPLFVGFVLLGGLLGWLVSYVSPSPYRATSQLFVGLNPFRAPDDRYVAAYGATEYRNRDDYKNWQMEQLNGLAYFDEVLGAALAELRLKDPYWEEVSLEELDQRLDLYWRSAGTWRMVAEGPDPQRAADLAEAWRAAVFEQSNQAIQASQQLYQLDLMLQAIEAEIVETQARQAELAELGGALLAFSQRLEQALAESELTLAERWELMRLAGNAAGFDKGWLDLLDGIPAAGSPAEAYLPWIDRLIEAVDLELEFTPSRLEALESQREAAFSQWEEAYEMGHGLAATLTVEIPTETAPEVEIVRQSGTAIVVGALVGGLFWAVLEVVRINRRRAG